MSDEGMVFTCESESTGETAAKAVKATVDTILKQGLPGASLDITGEDGAVVSIEIKVRTRQ